MTGDVRAVRIGEGVGHTNTVDVNVDAQRISGLRVDGPPVDRDGFGSGRSECVHPTDWRLVDHGHSVTPEQGIARATGNVDRVRTHVVGTGFCRERDIDSVVVAVPGVGASDVGTAGVRGGHRCANAIDVDVHLQRIGGVGVECPSAHANVTVADNIHSTNRVGATGRRAEPVAEDTPEVAVAVGGAIVTDAVEVGESRSVGLVRRVVVQSGGCLVLDENLA